MIQNKWTLSLVALAAFASFGLAGCNDDSQLQKTDPAAEAKKEKIAADMRALFDKAGGNYDSLSAEDKKAMDAFTGSEKDSREYFSHVYRGPGTGAAGKTGQGNTR